MDEPLLLQHLRLLPSVVVRRIMSYSPALYLADGFFDSEERDAVERRVRAVGVRMMRLIEEDPAFAHHYVIFGVMPLRAYVNGTFFTTAVVQFDEWLGEKNAVKTRICVSEALDASLLCKLLQTVPQKVAKTASVHNPRADGVVRLRSRIKLKLSKDDVPEFFRNVLALLVRNGLQGYCENNLVDPVLVSTQYSYIDDSYKTTVYALDVPTAEFDLTRQHTS